MRALCSNSGVVLGALFCLVVVCFCFRVMTRKQGPLCSLKSKECERSPGLLGCKLFGFSE